MRTTLSALALVPALAIALILAAGLMIHTHELALVAHLAALTPDFTSGVNFDAVRISPAAEQLDTSQMATLAPATPVNRASELIETAAANDGGVRPTLEASGYGPSRRAATPVSLARPHLAGSVPILMYHYIRINPIGTDTLGFNLSVTPDNFRLQMRFLRDHGYSPVSIADVREYVRNKTPLPAKPIAITFDDGYDDAYTEALPTLQRFRLTATFYIVTGFVDRTRYLTWEQVAALERDGMEIGSHTVHHRSLTVLGALQRQAELDDS